jgi:hypothetical protein
MRNAYIILMENPECGLGKFGRLLEYNVRMYIKKTGSEGAGRMKLADDMMFWRALVNTVMNLRVP